MQKKTATDPAVLDYLSAYCGDAGLIRLATRDVAHFIDGKLVAEGHSLPVMEPSRGAQLCRTFEAGAVSVDAAVQAARTALEAPGWADLRPLDRQALILSLAQKLEERADELAFLESIDVGKPLAQARAVDIGGSIDVLRYFAGAACRIDGRAAPLVAHGSASLGLTLKRPVGVVGAIIPWNFPLQTLVWKAAAALAAGCTLVIKPSEITPLTALRFAELTLEAGVPAGVLNVVNGTGPITGAALVDHPGVRMITFTGSTAAGRQIGRAALGGMKRLTLELGGKSPALITRHADLDGAVTGVLNGIFFNAGQICDAGSRVIVEDAVAEEFITRLVERARALPIGPGLAEGTFLGPLASSHHLGKVRSYLACARDDGLDLALDASDLSGPGYFQGPVVVKDCPVQHPIWREEVFGPLLAVRRTADLSEMLALAHDTDYGLGAAIFSRDHGEIMQLARSLRAGTIYVNGHGHLDPSFPFGGQGLSGFGKDLGPEQVDSYLETSAVLFAG